MRDMRLGIHMYKSPALAEVRDVLGATELEP